MTDTDRRIIEAAARIAGEPGADWSLDGLAESVALSPHYLQRRFKRLVGLSPLQYRNAMRLERARGALRDGRSITDAAFEAGFGSLSRFYAEAGRGLGMRPAEYGAGGEGLAIDYAVGETSLGLLLMAATERGICAVRFGETVRQLEQELAGEFPAAIRRPAPIGGDEALLRWLRALEAFIDAGGPSPDLPLHVFGTALQIRTWRFLTSIPVGGQARYKDVARAIGAPRAVRAVASAVGANPAAVLVPCHRVLRADGGEGGYRWGLERKRRLREREAARDAQ